MKNWRTFFSGAFAGVVLMLIIFLLGFAQKEYKAYKYVRLTGDYAIDNVGILKKGTTLRIDEPMPEGFTRYILYLNLKSGGTEQYETDKRIDNLVIPYWLQPVDTMK